MESFPWLNFTGEYAYFAWKKNHSRLKDPRETTGLVTHGCTWTMVGT